MIDPLATRILELSRPAYFTLSNLGNIDRWSPAAEELYGYSEADAVGRPTDFLFFPGQYTAWTAQAGEPSSHERIERHRQRDGTEVFVALRLSTLESGLLVCVRDVSAEQRTQTHLTASRDALDAGRGELRRLAGRLLSAQETERRRIARELHDDFKQRLGALGFQLAVLAERSRQGSEEQISPDDFDTLVLRVEELGTDIRRISHQLHPAALERLGLAAALQAHTAKVETNSGITVRFLNDTTDDFVAIADDEFALETALGLYRIAQEALDNAVRHAEATRIEVKLQREGHDVRMHIADNGVGFETTAASPQDGLGMASMRERARLLGGRFLMNSSSGQGTEIEVTVPWDVSHEGTLPENAGGGQGIDSTKRLGPYKLLELLHEGAKATVYLAEEPPPLRRTVAIKLHREPLAGRRETLSFKAERQALAKLQHRNIGQIYEAHTTEDGDPYIVMEYVPGMAITLYCDRYRLGLRERLELFLEVCEGVAYIHQKGVVHRNLEPANVLVMEKEGRPFPKLVAFGIAKGLDQPLAEGTVWTHGVVDSPAYVSPEVLEGQEADTRTDVYALGVLLYELLAGVLPAENETRILAQLAAGGHPLPSHRLASQDAAKLKESANARRSRPRALVRSLRGDLDWIVSKTLAPAPRQRYTGAAALAEDLRRHLNNEPVLAGPQTLGYLLGRLVRRHRILAAVGVVVLLTLLLGLVGGFWS